MARIQMMQAGVLAVLLTSCVGQGELSGAKAPEACSVQRPYRMNIETVSRAPIDSKDVYLDAQLTIAESDDFAGISIPTRVRGRGNSTWDLPKKPYRLKLDKKTSLIGMPADKDWVLLANFSDKTMLRNAVAMCLGRILEMEYVPEFRFVELTVNGAYEGTYQLSEHIKTSDQRVDIGAPASGDDDADAGFLLEIDERLDEELWFHSSLGIPYTVKSDASPAQFQHIIDYVNVAEQGLYGDPSGPSMAGAQEHIDVASLIDFYLVNELMRNSDAFWSSTYVYRRRLGKLKFGPLWDFDIAAGNIDYNGNGAPVGWWVRFMSPYVERLLDDPAFATRLSARWVYLHSRLPELQRFVDDSAHALDAAQQLNFQRWDILDVHVWPNAVVTGSYRGEVAYLKGWLDRRASWMDQELSPVGARP